MVEVVRLAANAARVPETTIRSMLRRTRSAASSGRRSRVLFGKPILNGDVFSFNPAKLAQLLPERLHENRATSSSACIQETDAEDFSRSAARRRGTAKQQIAWRAKCERERFYFGVADPTEFATSEYIY